MAHRANYQTRQQALVAEYLTSLPEGQAITAAEAAQALRQAGTPIGLTTIYRQLAGLVAKGWLRRIMVEGVASVCYETLPTCVDHLHLKCEDCGALVHLDCEQAQAFESHVQASHGFAVNHSKTVLYGRCGHCLEKNGKEDGQP